MQLSGQVPNRLARILVPALLLNLLTHFPAFAQERFGEVQGTASDVTGAVVPNVKVSLTETTSNRVTTKTTGPDGTYVFRSVEPGQYTVRFEATGFGAYQ